ncbi:MAG: DUF924 domain-containing protein [Cyanosarcina radialis HA8281-LM2]|jgi:uncharacterized protein (DUF924 family)|nr:DUF924 domain-containing protein [Cyanosarcina radialis HA8281-LM2]
MSDRLSQVNQILELWFGSFSDRDYGKQRQFWFTQNPEFDRQLQTQFLTDCQQAAAGKLDDWQDSPASCLALIILLDQFPRNIFRGTPQAFATDSQALAIAKYAIDRGYDRQLLPVQRWFVYLPFEHSENLEDQNQSVALFQQLKDDRDSEIAIASAIRHREIIERFGRFPHRNQILGRQTTQEEAEFLQQPGSSFRSSAFIM